MPSQTLLFICFANTCRSPMAEAIARHLGGDRNEVFSAGLFPTGTVAPLSLQTLESLGHSTAGLYSKGLDDIELEEVDVVVSLMGPDGLAGVPRRLPAERIVWSIRDPYGEDEEAYFATARILEQRIRQLLEELKHRGLSAL
ncbi:MAG: hypothetical protein K8R59_16535 [Thermoanaerobaculales bacterium]|nr:hypothetical protein [Thermoanaerobaculales bacterium]